MVWNLFKKPRQQTVFVPDAITIAAAHFYLPLILTLRGDDPRSRDSRESLARLWLTSVRALNFSLNNAESPVGQELAAIAREEGLLPPPNAGPETMPSDQAVTRAFNTVALIARWVIGTAVTDAAYARSLGVLLGAVQAIHHYLWTGEDSAVGFADVVAGEAMTVFGEVSGHEQFEYMQCLEVLHLRACDAMRGGIEPTPLEWIRAHPGPIPAVQGEGLPDDLVAALRFLPSAASLPPSILCALRASHWWLALAEAISQWTDDDPEKVHQTIAWGMEWPLGWNANAVDVLKNRQ